MRLTARAIKTHINKSKKIAEGLLYGYNQCIAELQPDDSVKFLYRGVEMFLSWEMINKFTVEQCVESVKNRYLKALFMKESGFTEWTVECPQLFTNWLELQILKMNPKGLKGMPTFPEWRKGYLQGVG